MGGTSSAQRRLVVEQLSGWLHRFVEDEANEVEFHIERGLDRAVAEDLESMNVRPNGTSTLIVRINGGARPTLSTDDPAEPGP